MRPRFWIVLHLLAAALPVTAALARLPDVKLFGVETKVPPPPPTFGSWVNESIQHFLTTRFESGLGFRGVLVRTDNSVYATLGETKPDAVVKAGRGGALFIDDDLGYAAKRRVDLPREADIAELSALVAEAQRKLATKGKRLAVVIAPSKTSLWADEVPSRWRRPDVPRSDVMVHRELVDALVRDGVDFVDGPSILRPQPRDVVFPWGARHWSSVGACLVLRAAAVGLTPSECSYGWRTVEPRDPFVAELDLFRLEDAWHPFMAAPRVPVLTEPSERTKNGPRTLFVGTSFSWALIAVARPYVSRATCFYYNSTIYDATDAPRELGPVDTASITWTTLALDEDVYVLELFEGYVHAPFLRDFLRALLARL